MSAKQQVTITLGGSGQVVKRSGDFESDYGSSSGLKRSMNSSDDYGGKRLRRENQQWSSDRDMNNGKQYQSCILLLLLFFLSLCYTLGLVPLMLKAHQIGRNDLRFKLMQKRRPSHDEDLRRKLSRTSQTPQTHYRFSSGSVSSSGRIPPARNADDHLHMDSVRFRRRSPDRLLGSSQRNYDDIHRRSTLSSLDPPRSAASVVDVPRPAAFSSKGPSYTASVRPPPSVTTKAPYLAGDPTNVSSLLHSLGLEKYAVIFQAEEVDMAALKQMGDTDLKELGIPMGPRKKILLALVPRAAQPRRP